MKIITRANAVATSTWRLHWPRSWSNSWFMARSWSWSGAGALCWPWSGTWSMSMAWSRRRNMDIYNQTDKQLEDRLYKHKHTMRLMLIVFVLVIVLNILLTLTILFEFLPIVSALLLAVINMLSVWWLSLGGKWR